jgi:RNA polymerase sigma factor (sigma-70 family)
MKSYNSENYERYKRDLENKIGREYFDLVENIARKFNTSYESSGVMCLQDLIQEGVIGLLSAKELISNDILKSSEYPDRTLKSFLTKRIKGAIRRAVDSNRSAIRIPEHKINDLRHNPEENELLLNTYLNNTFISLDKQMNEDGTVFADTLEIEEEEYKQDLLMYKLIETMNLYLSKREMTVLQLSFGINEEKLSAKEIAEAIGLKGQSAYVRVSEIKKEAITKLQENMDYSQFLDLL